MLSDYEKERALNMAANQAMLEQLGLVESPLIEPKKPRAPREKRERAPEVVPDRTLRNRETIKRPRDANFVDDQDDRYDEEATRRRREGARQVIEPTRFITQLEGARQGGPVRRCRRCGEFLAGHTCIYPRVAARVGPAPGGGGVRLVLQLQGARPQPPRPPPVPRQIVPRPPPHLAPPQQAKFKVQVPQGMASGQTLLVSTGTHGNVRCVIPPNMVPGQYFHVVVNGTTAA